MILVNPLRTMLQNATNEKPERGADLTRLLTDMNGIVAAATGCPCRVLQAGSALGIRTKSHSRSAQETASGYMKVYHVAVNVTN